ncbi:carbohydrate kinase family protein [Kineococcus rhizosphaerae]|uniref:Sugar/nucleoside kinase (Ribokinase family) n=1 Tax=Kineococcus rhizosphaerae TaxID=559628 RepID=A0A2T0QZL8_9ACTN|nr:sugar kinase [Kineococcus rhizosphaerae]PRY12134.1 sugar/nucleoside kinase (ribokinase family) [Kineococcus rhizosphaerae]
MPQVVSFGAHIADALGWPFTQVPPGQQLAILEQIRFTVAGTAAAPSVNLAKLGVDVATVGRVGADTIGDFVRTTMDGYGVDTTHLVTDPVLQTSASLLPIRADGSRPALHVIGANAGLREDDVPWDVVAQAQVFHLGGLFVLPGVDGEPAGRILARARELGLTTTVDLLASPRPDAQDLLAPVLPHVDFLLPNVEEAGWITGREDYDEIARWFHDRGVGTTLLTLGGDGVHVARAGERGTVLPAFAVDVVDSTGCGDALTAGFVSGLLDGLDLHAAAERGLACGSLVATGLGSDAGIVDLAQVEEFARSTPRAAVAG